MPRPELGRDQQIIPAPGAQPGGERGVPVREFADKISSAQELHRHRARDMHRFKTLALQQPRDPGGRIVHKRIRHQNILDRRLVSLMVADRAVELPRQNHHHALRKGKYIFSRPGRITQRNLVRPRDPDQVRARIPSDLQEFILPLLSHNFNIIAATIPQNK